MAKNIGKGRRITGTERDAMARELSAKYAKGESIRALAVTTGRSYGFIHGVLCEAGVELRGRGSAGRRKAKS